MVRQGGARAPTVRLAIIGLNDFGQARRGLVWSGVAGSGKARASMAQHLYETEVRRGTAGLG